VLSRIDHISTQSFYANAADLELRLLAMNQIILFAKNVLKQSCPRLFASLPAGRHHKKAMVADSGQDCTRRTSIGPQAVRAESL
jgi:hypothetical protein